MNTQFLSDPSLADARRALSGVGLPLYDVKVTDKRPKTVPDDRDMQCWGQFNEKTKVLWVVPDNGDQHQQDGRLFATVHEYGHALWAHAVQNKDQAFANKMADILDVIHKTHEIQRLEKEIAGANLAALFGDKDAKRDLPALVYFDDPNEAWARAVCQYALTQPEFQPLWERFVTHGDKDYYTGQWSDKDFAPIAAAFAKAFPVTTAVAA